MASQAPAPFEPLPLVREDFPDPLTPVPLPNRSVACAAQRQRRSDILCNVRRLLGEEGYGGVSLKQVAEHSGVSVQTVYNLVGNRSTLIGDAVVEHIEAHARLAFSRGGYPNPIVGLSDLYWEGAALYPQYTRSATLTYFPPDRPLFELIRRRGDMLMRDAFRIMAGHGHLRTADLGSVSSRITGMQTMNVLDALTGLGDFVDLRHALVHGAGMMLLPVVTPQHAKEIEAWLAAFDPAAIDRPGRKAA